MSRWIRMRTYAIGGIAGALIAGAATYFLYLRPARMERQYKADLFECVMRTNSVEGEWQVTLLQLCMDAKGEGQRSLLDVLVEETKRFKAVTAEVSSPKTGLAARDVDRARQKKGDVHPIPSGPAISDQEFENERPAGDRAARPKQGKSGASRGGDIFDQIQSDQTRQRKGAAGCPGGKEEKP